MGRIPERYLRPARRKSLQATGQVPYSPLWQPSAALQARVYPSVHARGRGEPTGEQAGERMRRLTATHPRKRRRRYEMTVLLQRQVGAASSVVRIKPVKRIFGSAAPYHF